MSRVEVLVPWRPGCPDRERAWAWVSLSYATSHPDWSGVLSVPPAGPWVKANAIMPAARASAADIVVVADADVWCEDIGQAVEAVETGAAWAIPHDLVHRLSRAGTDELLEGHPPHDQELAERPYRGTAGGGIVVLPRTALLEVPIDHRFEGWGGEDESWGYALRCIYGQPWRGTALLAHLWHPPQPRTTRKVGSPASATLRRRYALAGRDPDAMRDLLQEVNDDADPALEPAVRHHAPH